MNAIKILKMFIIISAIVFIVACSKNRPTNITEFNISDEKIAKTLSGLEVIYGKDTESDGSAKSVLLKNDSFELEEVQVASIDKLTNVTGFISIKKENGKKIEGIFVITYIFDNKWIIKDMSKNILFNVHES